MRVPTRFASSPSVTTYGAEGVQVALAPGVRVAGAQVTVNALDYGADPVAGRLVGLSLDEVVLQRDDPRAGRVHVHFPRIGYQIKAERKD